MSRLTIVIPAYNEMHRLPQTLQTLQSMHQQGHIEFPLHEVIVVNDGSSDETASVAQKHADLWPLLKLESLEQNRGKGAAVYTGMRKAQGEWILVADADMATPWGEINHFHKLSPSYDLIMGSRALRTSQIAVRQHWVRQTMGKCFNKIIRSLVGIPFRDTQCGFKLLRNDEHFRQRILPHLKVEKFAWDVELILWMQRERRRLLEHPVRWEHKEASHVHIFKDSIEMLKTVWQMRSVEQQSSKD